MQSFEVADPATQSLTREWPAESDGLIVDSHQHFWQVGRFDYPWMSPNVEVLYQDYLPPRLEPELDRCGVKQTVVVQASNSLEETRWLLRLADQHRFINGVVGWVDLTAENIEQQLDEFEAQAHLKGVRHLVESEPADDWLCRPVVLENLRRLGARGITYDLLIHPRHLKYAKTVAESCPGVRLVVDHLAKPPIARGEIDEWARGLKRLAAHENVCCKISGLVTEAVWNEWRKEHLHPYVEIALEYFGARRLMFGSDWPVCLLAASYERVLDAARALLSSLSHEEQRRIFSGNAIEFYRLERQAPAA